MDSLLRDLRQAGRALRAAPVVTLAALLTLALGIGTTTAIFSVANALILRPLPVRDPHQLVTITSETALRHGFQAGAGWNYAMWDQLRQRADAFDNAFAWMQQRMDLAEGGEMQPVDVLIASGGVFTMLGVDARAGRLFTAADDVRGGGVDGAVAVISYDLWQRRFNRADTAIGSRLSLDGVLLTIVGVAPQRFRGVDVGQAFDVAIPFGAESVVRGPRTLLDAQRAYLLTVMLRLPPQQSVSEATAMLRSMQPQILGALRDPPPFLREPFMLVPASTGISDRSRLRQQYQRPLVTLAIVSGLVLVIVCANVANLLLARAAARRRELAVRVALGAPRWQLTRQLLVEGCVLGGAGAAAGLLFATWASRGLVAWLPAPGGAVHVDVSLDARVLAFTAAIAVLGVVLFATVPAFQAWRARPVEALQDEGRAVGASRARRLTAALLVAQIAVSIVLVTAAGLFVRTLNRLAAIPLGLQPQGLAVITVDAARTPGDPAARLLLYDRIVEAIRATPGVTRAAASVWTPLGAGGGGLLTDARGRRADAGSRVAHNFVTPDWFATYGTALRAGREFDARDGASGARVAIVNESLRRTLNQERAIAVGDTIDAGPCGRGGCTVVGIVEDAVYGRSLRDGPPPTVYVPLSQSAGRAPPAPSIRVSIRSSGDLAAIVRGVAAALQAVDRGLAFSVRPLEADVNDALAQERLVALLAASFGVVALVLSGVGLYGTTAYAVARRRGEIGIRLALGAQPAGVVRLVMTRVAVLVMAGTAAGLLASAWLSRFVAPLLYGLAPRDPATLLASTAVLSAVAAAAAWLPPRRASRLDPAHVLRQQ